LVRPWFRFGRRRLLCGEITHDHVAAHRSIVVVAVGIDQVATEDGPEGVAVGHPEDAEGADHHVNVNGIDVRPEQALRPPAFQDVAQQRDHRSAEVDERDQFFDVLGEMDVLDADEVATATSSSTPASRTRFIRSGWR
jgi:hypothetical protein